MKHAMMIKPAASIPLKDCFEPQIRNYAPNMIQKRK